MVLSVITADDGDAAALAALAAETFPLACPADVDPADIAAAIAENLSEQRFAECLADPDRVILIADDDGRMVGYAMLIRGIGDDPDIAAAVRARPAVEVSKMYVRTDYHRSGASAALMRAGIAWAEQYGAAAVWLGVNRDNERAQRFYRKHGFQIGGTRTFRLGSSQQADFVMVRAV